MDIWLFITSSSTIAPYFSHCARTAEKHQGTLTELFIIIRKIGIQYEKKLLHATRQINTQRGILFAGAILATAAGWLCGRGKALTDVALSDCVSELCRDLCQNDFAILAHRPAQTNGEKLYLEHGITGIRGEAEKGFPLVRDVGLPAFHQALAGGLSWRESLIHTLLALMARCEDTTALSRAGPETLKEMQQRAGHLFSLGGMFCPAIERQLADFDAWCLNKWVSPGGSADLLALCLATYFLCDQHHQNMAP